MRPWIEYGHFLLTLLVIIDPFMAAPLFLGFTRGYSVQERRRTARVVSLTVLVALTVAALSGDALLRLFGATLGSFRVAGGIVLFLMALGLLKVRTDPITGMEPHGPAESAAPSAVVPLAIPLLAGPGAVSAVIVGTSASPGWLHTLVIVGCVAVASAALWGVLRAAEPIGRLLGPIGLDVMNRLFGLLVAAFATEMVVGGLRQLFPVLAA
jgi:multiple antibiotic resistance protein